MQQRLLVQLQLLLRAGGGVGGRQVRVPELGGGAVDERRAYRLCKEKKDQSDARTLASP